MALHSALGTARFHPRCRTQLRTVLGGAGTGGREVQGGRGKPRGAEPGLGPGRAQNVPQVPASIPGMPSRGLRLIRAGDQRLCSVSTAEEGPGWHLEPGIGEGPVLFGLLLGRVWARPPTQWGWQGHLFTGLCSEGGGLWSPACQKHPTTLSLPLHPK